MTRRTFMKTTSGIHASFPYTHKSIQPLGGGHSHEGVDLAWRFRHGKERPEPDLQNAIS